MKVWVFGLLLALQAAHDPQPCNRIGGTAPDGTVIHACQCHRIGTPDGEGCAANVEDRNCAAWCRRDWCGCPIFCDVDEP